MQHDQTPNKKKNKGYIALMNNVFETKLELWHILQPLEYFLVDVIIEKTIKWRDKEAKIHITEFEARTKLRRDYIYIALKKLETEKIIVRRKVRHDWIIGLNEDYFGALLIKKHENALLQRRNKIKIIVDNSKNKTRFQSGLDLNSVQLRLDSSLVQTGIQSESNSQTCEIIEENRPLKTLLKDISLKTSLKDSKNGSEIGESYTLPGIGNEIKKKTGHLAGEMTPQEIARRKEALHQQRLQLEREAN